MLLQIPDLLTPDEVRQARQALAGAPWADGRDSAGPQAATVKNNEQLPHDCAPATFIRQLVLRALDRHPLFLTAALPKKIFTPRINRYGGDTPCYGAHVDNAIRFRADTGERVRTDVSCTVFLADPADYDGGELLVQDTYGARGVKLPAGHAVLYPGTSIHEVTPVTRGHRLACFFWIQSMVRTDEQRRLLFDMDNHLIDLRIRMGETDPNVIGLTSTYHNLLRMWLDV